MNPDVERADPALSAALLIGCESYPRSDLPMIPAVQNNLDGMEAAFKDPELWGLRRLRLSVQRDLEYVDFLDAVADSARLSDPDGLFVLYFFGHAEKHDGVLYLAPSDADRKRPQDSMVSVADVFRSVDEARGARRKLLILDCCFAAQAVRAVPGEATPALQSAGWYVMAATAANTTALARPDRTNSLFTGALLEAFKGTADAARSLSPRWVFERVSALVPEPAGDAAARLVPHSNTADWADGAWLRNRLFKEPERTATPYPEYLSTPAVPLARPYGFRSWPSPEPLYVGRTEELRRARERLRQRVVLPIRGPRYAGKAAFVRELLSSQDVLDAGPAERPWLLFEITVTNASAERPVLEAMASALEIRLQEVSQEADAHHDPRRDVVMERLKDYTRGHTLLLVIDCGRLGYDSEKISAELDDLLQDPYFRDTASLLISPVRLMVDGSEQLEPQPEVQLVELAESEAASLLTGLLAQEKVLVDGASVLAEVRDRRLRLPGILSISTKGFLSEAQRALAAPEPSAVVAALLEGSAPSVAKSLDEMECRLVADTTDPCRGPTAVQALATLTVWALTDDLALPSSLLEDPALGITRRKLRLLEDCRVLSHTIDGTLEIGQVSKQALRSLLLAALSRGDELDDPLVPRPLDRELRKLFDPRMGPQDIDGALAVAASALCVVGLGTHQDGEESAERSFLRGLRWAAGWIEGEGGKRLPRLYQVLEDVILAPAGDNPYLPITRVASEVVVQHPEEVAGDQVTARYRLYPVVATLTLKARAVGSFEEIGAEFMAAAEELSEALAACDPEQVPPSLLRSVDASLALTGRRLGLTVRLLHIRRSATTVLISGARRRGPGQPSRVTLAISWLLNTADAHLDIGETEEARELVDTCGALIDDYLQHDGSTRSLHTRLQLKNRIARVRSRCLQNAADRRLELRSVVENAVTALELAHDQNAPLSLWTRRLFEAGQALMQESSTDEDLLDALVLVKSALEHCYGTSDGWSPEISMSTARFVRKCYARCSDPGLKYQGAQEATQMLTALLATTHKNAPADIAPGFDPEAGPTPVQLAQPDLSQLLVALARAHRFLAHALRENQRFGEARSRLSKAEEFAREAVTIDPCTTTYSALLHLVLDQNRTTPRTGKAGEESEARRRDCVRAVRRWLVQEGSSSREHALLDLVCMQSDWAVEGSLHAASQLPGEDFSRLIAEEQRERITWHYHARSHKLRAHRHRFGNSVECCILAAQLEREYRRWSGILDHAIARKRARLGVGPGPATKRPQVDNGPVLALFRSAEKQWPGDTRLQEAMADFSRYIWNDANAVAAYDRVAQAARNGETWSRAKLASAEALLAQVQHAPPSDAAERRNLLERAQGHLEAIDGHSQFADRLAVLRERVRQQLGQEVDWEHIDSAFETIVGGDYAGTVGRYLDRRRHGEVPRPVGMGEQIRLTPRRGDRTHQQDELLAQFAKYGVSGRDGRFRAGERNIEESDGSSAASGQGDVAPRVVPGNVAELLLTDFTSVELLQGMGQLYMSRAQSLMEVLTKAESLEGDCLLEASTDLPGESQTSLETWEDAVLFAWRAYDCFDACRVLQEAIRNESSVMKFLRGRAITLAARCAHSPEPFPWSGKGDRSLLEEGNRLLLAARRVSVGRFYKVCAGELFQNNRLLEELGLRAPRR
ncbi:caspase family protein [Streptomyces durocortorensis]|uniref:Caspase family protein n=1 Tax=Streptomyces durocortorensis TaxID=2811104 RepID=A0ABS2HRW6_9ACTN|nr:caspase family protein [Streptomyces durocortorensis]MBM7052574.1 caspase family protein [Streptomyces durocortorensis]